MMEEIEKVDFNQVTCKFLRSFIAQSVKSMCFCVYYISV